jgi:desulfoferrodoxin (superoxide reductase-like protein)
MNDIRCNLMFILVFSCSVVSFSCSDIGNFFGKDNTSKAQKFYSADEPGMWEAQAADHEVRVSIVDDARGKKGIEVYVPFTKEMSDEHYVETIVLLDEKNRQLSEKSFSRGEKAQAIFEVTDKIRFPVYAVAKCNMHGMWRKKVDGTEKPKDLE